MQLVENHYFKRNNLKKHGKYTVHEFVLLFCEWEPTSKIFSIIVRGSVENLNDVIVLNLNFTQISVAGNVIRDLVQFEVCSDRRANESENFMIITSVQIRSWDGRVVIKFVQFRRNLHVTKI